MAETREETAARRRAMNALKKEIGPLPEVADTERRDRCRDDLLEFMLTYGRSDDPEQDASDLFTEPFCDEQIKIIRNMEDVALHGGDTAACIFRGAGKSMAAEWCALWSVLYDHCDFVVIVAATTSMAKRMLANVKIQLEHNDKLLADFPAACYPIRRLERVIQRGKSQTLNGQLTEMTYKDDLVQLAKVPGHASSQNLIKTTGLDAAFRGVRYGKYRPDLVILDDPQTDESARSMEQTRQRWDTVNKQLKGLAGMGRKFGVVATVTVIEPEDLAERILKEWGGHRYGVLRSMPTRMDAWEAYKAFRYGLKYEDLTGAEREQALAAYYREHYAELTEGAEATWEPNHRPLEVDAVQHAMNLWCDDEISFWSEQMNRPIDQAKEEANLTREEIEGKISKTCGRGVVPLECETLTAAVDVQKTCLYWMVCAWDTSFGGQILDYGKYPRGKGTFSTAWPQEPFEGAVAIAMTELVDMLANAAYTREDGQEMAISRVLLDANWGDIHTTVKQVCKDAKAHDFARPLLGWAQGPNARFFAHRKRPGEERGEQWYRPPLDRKRGIVRHYMCDMNWWKSFTRARLQAHYAAISSLRLYKARPSEHRDLIDALLSEVSSKLHGTYGTIDKWVLKPRHANHLWDCLVYCTICASTLGVTRPVMATDARPSATTQAALTHLPHMGQLPPTGQTQPPRERKERVFADTSKLWKGHG